MLIVLEHCRCLHVIITRFSVLATTIFQYIPLTIQLEQLWALRTSSSEDGVAALSWPPSESDDDESSMHTLDVEGSVKAIEMNSFSNP